MAAELSNLSVYEIEKQKERQFLASKGICPGCFGTGNVNIGDKICTPILGKCPECEGTGEIKENKENE
jgi:DnaJ-class molecular chaperone